MDIESCHVRRYSKHELVEKVTKAGFTVDYISGFVSLLLPAMYLQRKLLNKISKKGTQIRQNSILNKLFRIIMKIEYLLLKIGIKFNFGGSLILVAHKKIKV